MTLFRDMFSDAYDKCYNTVTVFAAWLLCWPMKLTFVCNLVQALGGANICDPEGKVDSGIGEGYAALKSRVITLLHIYHIRVNLIHISKKFNKDIFIFS